MENLENNYKVKELKEDELITIDGGVIDPFTVGLVVGFVVGLIFWLKKK